MNMKIKEIKMENGDIELRSTNFLRLLQSVKYEDSKLLHILYTDYQVKNSSSRIIGKYDNGYSNEIEYTVILEKVANKEEKE